MVQLNKRSIIVAVAVLALSGVVAIAMPVFQHVQTWLNIKTRQLLAGSRADPRALPQRVNSDSMDLVTLEIFEHAPIRLQIPDPRAKAAERELQRTRIDPRLNKTWVLRVPAAYIAALGRHRYVDRREDSLVSVEFRVWVKDWAPSRGPTVQPPNLTSKQRLASDDWQITFSTGANYTFPARQKWLLGMDLLREADPEHCETRYYPEVDLWRIKPRLMIPGNRKCDLSGPGSLASSFVNKLPNGSVRFDVICPEAANLSAGYIKRDNLRRHPITERWGTGRCNMYGYIGNWGFSASVKNNKPEHWARHYERIVDFLKRHTVKMDD